MHAVTRIKSHEQATRDARSYGNKAVVDIRLPQSVAAHGGSVWVYTSMSDRAPVESLWVYALLASLIPGHYLLTWRHPRPWVTSTKLVKTVGVVLGIFSQNVRLYQLSRCRPPLQLWLIIVSHQVIIVLIVVLSQTYQQLLLGDETPILRVMALNITSRQAPSRRSFSFANTTRYEMLFKRALKSWHVSLIYRTEPTTKKWEKRKSKN